MKKIVLLCAGGSSTSLMQTKMRKYAESVGFECTINAYGVNSAAQNASDADLILLAPQVRFNMPEVEKKCPGVHIETIDMMDYGMMNGEKVMKKVIEVLS